MFDFPEIIPGQGSLFTPTKEPKSNVKNYPRQMKQEILLLPEFFGRRGQPQSIKPRSRGAFDHIHMLICAIQILIIININYY